MPEPLPAPDPARLMAALNFTEIDLNANRTGDISLAQADRLRRTWQRTLATSLAVLIGVGLAAALFLYFGQRQQTFILSFIGIVLTVVNAYVMGRLVQARFRYTGDRRPPVIVQDGVIERVLRVVGRGRLYLLKIDGRELYVTRPIFNAFEDGKRYRLYRAPASKTILSAEKR